ncbi:MAG: GNAT family N-acetyltransferase [Dehalococcoidales bacterium]|nr:GNAT family N-acetyltransferase [Dehalococcoidales bacterium]
MSTCGEKMYVLSDFSDSALTEANLANLRASSPLLYNLPGTETYTGDEVTWCITDNPYPSCNVIFRTRLHPRDIDDTIESLQTRARVKGVPLRWYIEPGTEPANLGEYLERHSFTPIPWQVTLMAVELDGLPVNPPPVTGLEIVEIRDAEQLELWTRTEVLGFNREPEVLEPSIRWFSTTMEYKLPVRFYLAYLDGKPAATSMIVSAEGVGGIYYVATLPEFRNRGIGRAVTLKALEAAREAGYRIGTLQASAMGEPVYRGMGFRKTGELQAYRWSE